MNMTAEITTFRSLGGRVTIQAEGAGAADAVADSETLVQDLHRRLTRFEADSELSRLNRDPRERVPASEIMLRFAETVGFAGVTSGGLVDATLLDEVERAGYVESIDPDLGSLPDPRAHATAGEPVHRPGDWSDVEVDRRTSEVVRPPGLRLDSGGLGKGLAADLVAERMRGIASWAVECSGDLRFGGVDRLRRRVDVTSPTGRTEVIASVERAVGAVATSGTTRRAWDSGTGSAHHLIDPRTGVPARTGIVQASALAPTCVEAESRAKAALLSGPAEAFRWLPDGGVVVTEDGSILLSGPFGGEL